MSCLEVFLRFRNPLKNENDRKGFNINVHGNHRIQFKSKGKGCLNSFYKFDRIFLPHSATNELMSPSRTDEVFFEKTMKKKVRDVVLNGTSSVVLTYGCKGSGKSYTFFGPPVKKKVRNGMIYRSVNEIFDALNEKTKKTTELYKRMSEPIEIANKKIENRNNLEYKLFISFFEVNNDEILDLLALEPTKLEVKETGINDYAILGIREIMWEFNIHPIDVLDSLTNPNLNKIVAEKQSAILETIKTKRQELVKRKRSSSSFIFFKIRIKNRNRDGSILFVELLDQKDEKNMKNLTALLDRISKEDEVLTYDSCPVTKLLRKYLYTIDTHEFTYHRRKFINGNPNFKPEKNSVSVILHSPINFSTEDEEEQEEYEGEGEEEEEKEKKIQKPNNNKCDELPPELQNTLDFGTKLYEMKSKKSTKFLGFELDTYQPQQQTNELNKLELEKEGSFKLFVRFKQFEDQEIISGGLEKAPNYLVSKENECAKIDVSFDGKKKSFTFDNVFENEAKQKDLLDQGLSDFIKNFCNFGGDYNVCCYGKNDSGRSYTLFEEEKNGLVGKTVDHIFEKIMNSPQPSIDYKISISMFEIHREENREVLDDLLNPKKKNLEMGYRTETKDYFVEDLTSKIVSRKKEILSLLKNGLKKRKEKKGSQIIFSISIEQKDKKTNEIINSSNIKFVKLIGPEKTDGLKGNSIWNAEKANRLHSHFKQCINSMLVKSERIAYHVSTISKVLRGSLRAYPDENIKSGERKKLLSNWIFFLNCSPRKEDFNDTIETLNYGTRLITK